MWRLGQPSNHNGHASSRQHSAPSHAYLPWRPMIRVALSQVCLAGSQPRSSSRPSSASFFIVHTLPHLPAFFLSPSTTTLLLLVYRLPTSQSGSPSFASLGTIGCLRRCYSPPQSPVQLSHCFCTVLNRVPARHSLLQN